MSHWTENPFEARRISPGARRFRFPAGMNRELWWLRFQEAGYRGAIVGPHGTGKTTLLHELLWNKRPAQGSDEQVELPGHDIPAAPTGLPAQQLQLAKAEPQDNTIDLWGARALAVAVEPDGKRLRRLETSAEGFRRTESLTVSQILKRLQPDCWLVIDGFDRLSGWQRWRVLRAVKRVGSPLTVTSHQLGSLPQLPGPQPTFDLFVELVSESCDSKIPWTREELQWVFEQQQGNLREALFVLYDRWTSASIQPS